MVRGLDTFAAFFAGDEAHYVLIGGVATQLLLEDAGLQARATKDLDIVLCVEALDARFGEKLWAFIHAGGYVVRQKSDEPRCFYRFARPTDEAFPYMLEFFARAPGRVPLAEDAHLTPVPIEQAVASLSAILLDGEYYHFLHAHTRTLQGVRVVTEHALIPLKARAWLDLEARRLAGATIDQRNITKHRNDVLRLSQLVANGDRVDAPEAVVADVRRFVDEVRSQVVVALLGQLEVNETPASLLLRLQDAYGGKA